MLIKFWPEQTSLKFMNLRMAGIIFSVAMLAASAFFLTTRGLNFGVDFAGGTAMEIEATDSVNETSVRAAIPFGADVNAAVGADARRIVVIKFGDAPEALLDDEFRALSPEEKVERASGATNELVVRNLKQKLGVTDAQILRNDSVGPKVSQELFRDGITALVVALALMLAYIWYRFEWQFSIGAVAALAHDVTITLGVFAFLQLEFNLTTIAALLTIIGYSMNDTVVVFDRVR